MQLHQLRYFLAVAEERHFTRASRRLLVAQPSVSAQVRKLEAELGTELFRRARGDVSLTAAGEVLVPLARQVLADVDEAAAQVGELAGLRRGRLAVGATPSLAATLLPAVLSLYHDSYPGIAIEVAEAGSGDLVVALEEGQLDLALVILPVRDDRLETVGLAEEELVVVVGSGHRLSTRSTLRLAELRGTPLVMFREGYDLRAVTLAACRRDGFEPTLAAEGGEMSGVLALVAAGLGAAVVPSIVTATRPGLLSLRLSPAELRRTVGLAWRRGRRPSRAAAAFGEELGGSLRRTGWPEPIPEGLHLL